MAEITNEIMEKIKNEAKKIEFGQITLTFNGANDFITITSKNDERIYISDKKYGYRRG